MRKAIAIIGLTLFTTFAVACGDDNGDIQENRDDDFHNVNMDYSIDDNDNNEPTKKPVKKPNKPVKDESKPAEVKPEKPKDTPTPKPTVTPTPKPTDTPTPKPVKDDALEVNTLYFQTDSKNTNYSVKVIMKEEAAGSVEYDGKKNIQERYYNGQLALCYNNHMEFCQDLEYGWMSMEFLDKNCTYYVYACTDASNGTSSISGLTVTYNDMISSEFDSSYAFKKLKGTMVWVPLYKISNGKKYPLDENEFLKLFDENILSDNYWQV